MTTKKYIALENEITSFDKNKKRIVGQELEEAFSVLKQQPHYLHKKEITSTQSQQVKKEVLKTTDGNAYYIDGSVIEVATPPIEINYGFATRLTDAITIARENITNNIPLTHTGYSMHWNIDSPNSKKGQESYTRETFINQFLIPFQMFGLMPTSLGSAIRERYPRWEIMGDSIPSESQINATALLLGAYLESFTKNTKETLRKIEAKQSAKDNRLVYPNIYGNRHAKITTTSGEKTTQQFLNSFYQTVYQKIQELGTSEEIENLESFISRKQKLEIDYPKFWQKAKGSLPNKYGIHFPISYGEKTNILKKIIKNKKNTLRRKTFWSNNLRSKKNKKIRLVRTNY